jgi:hypothetical protein
LILDTDAGEIPAILATCRTPLPDARNCLAFSTFGFAIGDSQQSACLNSVSMFVDGQLHTMPTKLSQGLQQAVHRGAEVVQGLDNDGIDLVPDNGTTDRRHPPAAGFAPLRRRSRDQPGR